MKETIRCMHCDSPFVIDGKFPTCADCRDEIDGRWLARSNIPLWVCLAATAALTAIGVWECIK